LRLRALCVPAKNVVHERFAPFSGPAHRVEEHDTDVAVVEVVAFERFGRDPVGRIEF
jgi:hypothetical protein